MVSSPHLATTLLYGVSQRWSLYINRCVDVSASKALESPGANLSFSINTIPFDLEWGRYVGQILPGPLKDLLVWQEAA